MAFDAMDEDARAEMKKKFLRAIGGIEDSALAEKRRAEKAAPKIPTVDATLALVREGKALARMAEERGVKSETIIDHLEKLMENGRITRSDILYLADACGQLNSIQAAFRKLKSRSLKTVFAHLRGKASYADIRLARLLLPE